MTVTHQYVAGAASLATGIFLKNYVSAEIFNGAAAMLQARSQEVGLEWLLKYWTGGQLSAAVFAGTRMGLSAPFNWMGRAAVMNGVDALYGWRVPYVLETARTAKALREGTRTYLGSVGVAVTNRTD